MTRMPIIRAIVSRPGPNRQAGLSLIELMVALTIGLLLSFGIMQIFGASKLSYQLQEGLSRIQENGRFVAQFMQKDLRSVGFMGCNNDIGRFRSESFINHLAYYGGAPTNPAMRFQRPIEGFSYSGSVTPGAAPVIGAIADWTPVLPITLASKVVAGTDVLILRVFSDDSTPLTSWIRDPNSFTFRDSGFVEAGGVYAVQNCGSANLFVAATGSGTTATAPGDGVNIWRDPSANGAAWGFDATTVNYIMPAGNVLNAEVHRGEYFAFFVGLREEADGSKTPTLYVQHFVSGSTALTTDELADGIENMQVRFGLDTNDDGAVNAFQSASAVVAGSGSAADADNRWRDVRSVRLGFLIRGEPGAGVSTSRPYRVTDQTITPPSDRRMRDVYETTVALRNRIINS